MMALRSGAQIPLNGHTHSLINTPTFLIHLRNEELCVSVICICQPIKISKGLLVSSLLVMSQRQGNISIAYLWCQQAQGKGDRSKSSVNHKRIKIVCDH